MLRPELAEERDHDLANALAPLGIGISHLIVYAVGKQKEARRGDHEK